MTIRGGHAASHSPLPHATQDLARCCGTTKPHQALCNCPQGQGRTPCSEQGNAGLVLVLVPLPSMVLLVPVAGGLVGDLGVGLLLPGEEARGPVQWVRTAGRAGIGWRRWLCGDQSVTESGDADQLLRPAATSIGEGDGRRQGARAVLAARACCVGGDLGGFGGVRVRVARACCLGVTAGAFGAWRAGARAWLAGVLGPGARERARQQPSPLGVAAGGGGDRRWPAGRTCCAAPGPRSRDRLRVAWRGGSGRRRRRVDEPAEAAALEDG